MCKKIVIVGATSSIAHHCARLWAAKGLEELVLIGRDSKGLNRVSDDIKVRNPKIRVTLKVMNLIGDPELINKEVDEICENRLPDIILIAQGSLPDQIECQQDILLIEKVVEINAFSPIIWAESFASHLNISIKTTLAVIGSVAGDRARKSNYIYGSAKAMVASSIEGLQHRFVGTNIKVVLIKPGPTDTPMTRNLKNTGLSLASVDLVSNYIVRGIESGKKVIYTPPKWWLIMKIVKLIPNLIFDKMDI